MQSSLPKSHQQIQAFAKVMKLSQKELMEAAQISRTAANHYFHGQNEPRFSAIQQWGIVFGLNMNWLFFGEGPMFRGESRPDSHEDAVEETSLRQQVAHLRLVHERPTYEEPAQAHRDTKEVIIKGQDKEAFEAQIRLIDHVVEALAKTGAGQDMIQRAILALVSGAF